MTEICCAARFAATISGPKSRSDRRATAGQLRSNQPLPMHMTALASPNPSIAKLTAIEPKCAELPAAKMRMMAICKAISVPATNPTDM